MKKVGSIFLSIIFLASAMGVSINSHYCGKKLSSVGLVTKGCCCKKKHSTKEDCCKNKIKYVKIADDYSPSAQFHFSKVDIAPVVLNFYFFIVVPENSVSILCNNHSPPPKFADRVIAFRSILI